LKVPKRGTAKNINSYKLLFKKNLEYKKLKQEQVFKAVRGMFKTHDIEVSKEVYDEYHLENNTLKELIFKFMTKMHAVLLANRIFKRKPTIDPPKTEKKENRKKSDINLSDNSNINNKSEDKAMSDTEMVIKSKENFFNVVQNITKNMLREQANNQGKISVQVEPTVLPEFGDMLNKYKGSETPLNKSNEIVRESEIQIIVGGGGGADKGKDRDLSESKMRTAVPEESLKPLKKEDNVVAPRVEEINNFQIEPVKELATNASGHKTINNNNYNNTTSSRKESVKKPKTDAGCHCKCIIF
jgi:hypothetical protein